MKQSIFESSGLALEDIAFQSNMFFKELTMYFSELMKLSEKEILDSDIAYQLRECVKKHTNLNIEFTFKPNDGPGILLPALNKNNALFTNNKDRLSTAGLALIREANDVISGSVNIKTGKVSGVFAILDALLVYDSKLLSSNKLIAEEHAAITLHEIGHLFTSYEYISRTVTTNQVLAGLSKIYNNSESIHEREIVFANVKQALKLKKLDEKILAQTTDYKVAELVILTNITEESISELGCNIYDATSFEYLADQYVARYNAGRYMVTAIDKLAKSIFNGSYRNFNTYLAIESVKTAILLMSTINLIQSFSVKIAVSTFSGKVINKTAMSYIGHIVGYIGKVTSIAGFDFAYNVSNKYDDYEARYRRIRNQLIEQLKNKNNYITVDSIKEDIGIIDTILEGVEDRRTWFQAITDTLIANKGTKYNQIQLQKNLEAIAANDIFLKAAEFRQLTKA